MQVLYLCILRGFGRHEMRTHKQREAKAAPLHKIGATVNLAKGGREPPMAQTNFEIM